MPENKQPFRQHPLCSCYIKVQLDESRKQTTQFIYQTTLMESGFSLPDPKDFASRTYNSVQSNLNISLDATVEEEDIEEAESEFMAKTGSSTPKGKAESDKDVADTDLKNE
ncbi:hypothetical protein V6N12_071466 [Hibiscus sabdariffa]|uniref:Uncharacterized protein n=1 Tax=Hibiscus sabdariffa TaxID=183260 RepID=A0ABR2FJX2_9ROSI